VSDDRIDYLISKLTDVEIPKALSTFGPRIKKAIVLSRNGGKRAISGASSGQNLSLKAEQKISVQLRQNLSNLQVRLLQTKQ
jgi:predicted component of type VI protein secretion system